MDEWIFLEICSNLVAMCYFFGGNLASINQVNINDISLNLNQYREVVNLLSPVMDGFLYPDTVILVLENGRPVLSKAHWEFIPPWIENLEALLDSRKKGIPWLNATSEKLLGSKMFRPAALKRRCLVLASWFFEWRHFKLPGEKKDTTYPYAIGLKEQPYFYFAGIWQPWTDKSTGETINSFAIITTKANSILEQIHNTKRRMPTILTEDLASQWLNAPLSEAEIQSIASYQIDPAAMWFHPVSKAFKGMHHPEVAFLYPDLPDLIL